MEERGKEGRKRGKKSSTRRTKAEESVNRTDGSERVSPSFKTKQFITGRNMGYFSSEGCIQVLSLKGSKL